MFTIYIKRATELFGITHTREIYEKAIEVLPDTGARYVIAATCLFGHTCCQGNQLCWGRSGTLYACREVCLRYAELEARLGEIDRASAIYSHGSQISDPRVSSK